MTRYKHAHTGLVTPSPLDRWIDATLRAFAMLVLNVVSTFQMIARRPVVNATRQMPVALPRMKSDTRKEQLAVPQDSPIALMLRSAAKLRVSKHEGVLTHVSHKLQQREHSHQPARPSLRSSRRKSGPRASRVLLVTGLRKQLWIPACAGTSGDNPATSKKRPSARP